MNREELEKILLENQDEITGISVNDYFYNVDYILGDNVEFDNEPVVCAYEVYYQNEYRDIVETQFTMSDLLKSKNIKFYKHTLIEN